MRRVVLASPCATSSSYRSPSDARSIALVSWYRVALDGAITGRSLVAPDNGQLTCQQHSEECGFTYIDAVLRFTERHDPDQTTRSVAELWFRRDGWVMAKPFRRYG